MKTEIPRMPLWDFLMAMTPAERNKSRTMLRIMYSWIDEDQETKGHRMMSTEEQAKFLGLSFEETEAASDAVTEIRFPFREYIAKGFDIPGLAQYSGTAYRLDFPTRPLIYLESFYIFLDDSEPFKLYNP